MDAYARVDLTRAALTAEVDQATRRKEMASQELRRARAGFVAANLIDATERIRVLEERITQGVYTDPREEREAVDQIAKLKIEISAFPEVSAKDTADQEANEALRTARRELKLFNTRAEGALDAHQKVHTVERELAEVTKKIEALRDDRQKARKQHEEVMNKFREETQTAYATRKQQMYEYNKAQREKEAAERNEARITAMRQVLDIALKALAERPGKHGRDIRILTDAAKILETAALDQFLKYGAPARTGASPPPVSVPAADADADEDMIISPPKWQQDAEDRHIGKRRTKREDQRKTHGVRVTGMMDISAFNAGATASGNGVEGDATGEIHPSVHSEASEFLDGEKTGCLKKHGITPPTNLDEVDVCRGLIQVKIKALTEEDDINKKKAIATMSGVTDQIDKNEWPDSLQLYLRGRDDLRVLIFPPKKERPAAPEGGVGVGAKGEGGRPPRREGQFPRKEGQGPRKEGHGPRKEGQDQKPPAKGGKPVGKRTDPKHAPKDTK
jgi:hypothetical protein